MGRENQKIRSDQVRQLILDTALEIGLKEGFPAVSIRKISKMMNYSTGVIYHHFLDKQEIIDAIEQAEMRPVYAQVVAIVHKEKDLFKSIESVFHLIMRLAFEEPEKYNLIILHKYSRQTNEKSHERILLAEKLREAMAKGTIRLQDPEMAAFAVWSSFHGFNLMISRYKDLTEENAEKLFQVQLDMVIHGLRKD
jgi:AcrR family transcriptional regulator